MVTPLAASIEAALAPHLRLLQGRWQPVARLQSDLAALGAAVEVPRHPIVAVPMSTAAAFGAAYVLQGSLLGGRTIAAAMERTLSLRDEHMHYIRPRDVDLGVGWRDFTAALNAFGAAATPAQIDEAVAAALAAFRAFDAAFTEAGFR